MVALEVEKVIHVADEVGLDGEVLAIFEAFCEDVDAAEAFAEDGIPLINGEFVFFFGVALKKCS